MDTKDGCFGDAFEAAKLVFSIVARSKHDDGVVESMLDTLMKLSKSNGDAPRLVKAMKEAVCPEEAGPSTPKSRGGKAK